MSAAAATIAVAAIVLIVSGDVLGGSLIFFGNAALYVAVSRWLMPRKRDSGGD